MADTLKEELKLIGSRIRASRQTQKMSQADLAEKAGLSLPHISEIELGKCQMSILTFCRIIEALQVSADSILRSNVPTVNTIYVNDFGDIFGDCTPIELEALMNIVKSVKANMRTKSDE